MTSSPRQTQDPLPLPSGPANAAAGVPATATTTTPTTAPSIAAKPTSDDRAEHLPPDQDDGLLDSIGKAISSPITGAAEDEEPA